MNATPMNVLRFIQFAAQNSHGMVWAMVGAGVVAGLLSAGVIAFINSLLHREFAPSWWLLAGYVALIGGKILSGLLSQLLLVRFTQNTIMEMSLRLCAKILDAPLRQVESRGAANILVTLTDDVSSVTWAIQCFPALGMNAAVVAGCGLYLAWLSWPTFLGVVGVTALGAGGYQLLHARAFHIIYAAREARAVVFGHFRSLTEGMKELRMHRGRREEFLHQEVREAADRYRHTNLKATTHYALADAWTQGSFYGLIGVLVFLFPSLVQLSPEALTGYVVAVLYMMGPIWSIIGSVPVVGRGQVALANIERLGMALDECDEPPAHPIQDTKPISRAPLIELNQVLFTYQPEKAEEGAFTLGPVTVDLRPGHLVFVVGGNGSGKSTFVKVLTGLYAPQSGTLKMAGTPITEANREWYREHFSVVFADFHVFDRLLGITDATASALASRYLALLQIDQKVSLRDRRFSTVELSQGQRKRLALVTAYLEDRPIYVFDEWAADQDPQYKEIFYRTLLPDLRARGKLVIVITHDDRYFHLGDHVVKLEDGKVVESTRTELRSGQRMSLMP